jgi:adenine/guanine phosphoribosyltransferase-like PRPP-binding protein
MLMKKFTQEARFDCGLDEVVSGKLWAFVAVVDSRGISLGVAVANEPGYMPVPRSFCHGDTYDAMHAHAMELNRDEGLTEEAAMRIICSSMAAGRLN